MPNALKAVSLLFVASVAWRSAKAQADTTPQKDTVVYHETEVDELPVALPGNPRAHYPVVHPLNMQGTVIIQVVIDTTGHIARGSIVLMHSTDERLTQPVLDVAPLLRFGPARLHGRRVKVRTELTFTYPPPAPEMPSGLFRPVDQFHLGALRTPAYAVRDEARVGWG